MSKPSIKKSTLAAVPGPSCPLPRITRNELSLGIPGPARFPAVLIGIAALVLFSSTAGLADWLSDSCKKAAQRYDYLLKIKSRATPERIADVYTDEFLIGGAQRDAQEVWRIMHRDGLSAEAAIEKHFERVRRLKGDLPENEVLALQTTARNEVKAMATTHELIRVFEAARIDTDFVAKEMEEGWSGQRWDAPQPVSYYIQQIRSTAKTYEDSGLNAEEAAVRAGVDVRALWDYHRGVPRSAITTKKSLCYKDALLKFEQAMRNKALRAAKGGLTAEEASKLHKNMKPDLMSRLAYYTQYTFGRHYFLDRIKVWAIAAGDMHLSSKR